MNPVLLSLVAKFNDTYIPLYEKGVLPKPLTHLYKATTLSYPDLLNKFEQVYQGIALTAEQVKAVEVKSRDQSGSKLWFQQRAGKEAFCIPRSQILQYHLFLQSATLNQTTFIQSMYVWV